MMVPAHHGFCCTLVICCVAIRHPLHMIWHSRFQSIDVKADYVAKRLEENATEMHNKPIYTLSANNNSTTAAVDVD